MAFYDQHPQHIRQQSWDTSQVPSRSGASSVSHGGEDSAAFRQQFEEIERAHENLMKARGPLPISHGRRESMPIMGQFVGQFPVGQEVQPRPDRQQWDSRQTDRMNPTRHQSVGDYEGVRSSSTSSSLQGFLQTQRFGQPRQSEAESMMQAKRRAAAQRERELRNYHQEQQYNRAQPGAKAERAMSPNTMNEEDRRDLIARQHRALYGEKSSLYDGQPRTASQDARALGSAASGHGSSPLGFDSFGQPSSSSAEGGAAVSATAGQGSRSRSNSTSKTPNTGTFAMFDNSHPRTSNSSPGDAASATQQPSVANGSSTVGAIGTRPTPAAAPGMRGTPPIPSPLGPGYGFGSEKNASSSAERSTPVNGTAPSGGSEKPAAGLGWGGANSAPWGSNKGPLGQASVWG